MKNNTFVEEELLAISKYLIRLTSDVKSCKNDTDYQAGEKEGRKEALLEVLDVVHGRLETLLNDNEEEK